MMIGEFKLTKVAILNMLKYFLAPEIGHYYSKLGPKSRTPFSPNPVKEFFLEIFRHDRSR